MPYATIASRTTPRTIVLRRRRRRLLPLCLCLGSGVLGKSSSTLSSVKQAQRQCRGLDNDSNGGTAPSPFVEPTTWLPSRVWEQHLSPSSSDDTRLPLRDVLSYSKVTYDNNNNNTSNHQNMCTAHNPAAHLQSVVMGRMPQFRAADALRVLQDAVAAWDGGSGVWPQLSLMDRVDAVRHFLTALSAQRDALATVLQWEIGKNRADAVAEIDRTVAFGRQLLDVVTTNAEYFVGQWQTVPGTSVSVVTRRAGVGVLLALAPYNYPINESYAAVLPALLMGNVVVLKIPTVGGLAHLMTMRAWQETLPAGAIHFVSGSGRETLPALMESGLVDGLAFVGGSKAADRLIHAHPHPHRLKLFLQLEAKNMAVLLPDLFDDTNEDAQRALGHAVKESVLGSLSYNGQRCTALKLFFCPTAHAEAFVTQLMQAVEAVPVGLSWERHDDGQGGTVASTITPLPNPGRVEYLKALLQDALDKGAKIVNRQGGTLVASGGSTGDGERSTLMIPAVVYPVTPDMRLYTEEQFGPIVPIAVYDNLETVLAYGRTGQYGQQVSLFGAGSDGAPPAHPSDATTTADAMATLIDHFAPVFGKININSQCGRSPDTVPFSGRRSSAMGSMSVRDALLELSVWTVVAHKNNKASNDAALAEAVTVRSKFLDGAETRNDKDKRGTVDGKDASAEEEL